MLESTNDATQENLKHSCEVCSKKDAGHQWMEPGNYWLCLACKVRREARVAASRVEQYSSATIAIDRAELFGLRSDGLIPVRTYIYFALRLDYPNGMPSGGIDLAQFCQSWEVNQSEILSAMGALSKKGIITLKTNKIEIESRTRAERLAALEKAVNP